MGGLRGAALEEDSLHREKAAELFSRKTPQQLITVSRCMPRNRARPQRKNEVSFDVTKNTG